MTIQEDLFLTIGNFDGIHRGHQQVLNNLTSNAKISKTKSAILSFSPHPKIFFNNEKNFLINSKEKKISILKNLNIDYLIDLKFDNDLTQLSFSEFEQNILLNKLAIKKLYLGKDFRYGNQRKGNLETLRSLCNAYNIKLEELALLNDNSSDEKISSSKVRQFLKNGEIERIVGSESIRSLLVKQNIKTPFFASTDMSSIDALFTKTSKVFGFFGYTTLMDCLELGCDYNLIPTPGQDEQIYLSKRHKKSL